MEALAICNKGFEEESIKEIKKILSNNIKNISHNENHISFEIKQLEDLAKLVYYSQTLHKVFLITSKSNSDISKIAIESIKNQKINLQKETKIFYKNYASREEEKKNSREMILNFAKLISDNAKANSFEMKFSMENYKTALYLIKLPDENYISGIDFSSTDLAKRDYRIFCHKNSLNATIAASLFYLLDINSKKEIKILDPFCGSASIPIEFTLKLENKSPHEFDEDLMLYNNFITSFDKSINIESTEYKMFGYDNMLNNVKASQKNAKIANINKKISFSKIAIDWLDTKFEEGEIDFIITDPPIVSKKLSQKEIDKIYKEFFYQTDFILNKKGKIIIITPNEHIKKFAQNYKLEKTKEVYQGNQKFFVYIFTK